MVEQSMKTSSEITTDIIPIVNQHDKNDIIAMKIIVHHLMAQGIGYSDIEEYTELSSSAIKQFVHRTSKRPRKTFTYFSLLKYLRKLNKNGKLKEICQLDSKALDSYNVLTSKHFIYDKESESTIQSFSEEKMLPTDFCPEKEYFLYRPLCDSDRNNNSYVKSKIEVNKNETEISYILHSCDKLNNNKTTYGTMRQYGSNIYLLGSISGKQGIEVSCFQIPQSDCKSMIPIVILTVNNCWLPICTNGLLVSGRKISNKEFGIYFDTKSNFEEEQPFLDIVFNNSHCVTPI